MIHKRIPQSDLDKMEARENAAKEGPWTAENTLSGIGVDPICNAIKVTYNFDNEIMRIEAQGIADFVAHSRTDQPRLRIAYQELLDK